MNITGNIIFIPGATSGIGLALALRLKKAGNTVIIGGRRIDVLDRLAADHDLDTVSIDTTDPAAVLAARDRVLDQYPKLNVLIAMAGVMSEENLRSADFLKESERIVDTNVLGPLRLIAAFIDHLLLQPDSTIITVSSGLAHTPLAITPTYNGSKAFIHLFSETMRLQYVGTPVKIVELVPPAVRTELITGGSVNPHFMPLEEFADETVHLLETQPDATEILVDRVNFLRFAEVENRYDATVAALNPSIGSPA
ncbi:MAG TPA: SDR family NAD(P)-dependent oxidoreductase [Pseudonocardiaceae bacterium]|jgi:short-subunit dehydrogenase involved in D-alanine esterification of teichoic acids|nr:SDR family NAD(P)-dependent oxidoreductase [Pseudonocardiaceae bacterium]